MGDLFRKIGEVFANIGAGAGAGAGVGALIGLIGGPAGAAAGAAIGAIVGGAAGTGKGIYQQTSNGNFTTSVEQSAILGAIGGIGAGAYGAASAPAAAPAWIADPGVGADGVPNLLAATPVTFDVPEFLAAPTTTGIPTFLTPAAPTAAPALTGFENVGAELSGELAPGAGVLQAPTPLIADIAAGNFEIAPVSGGGLFSWLPSASTVFDYSAKTLGLVSSGVGILSALQNKASTLTGGLIPPASSSGGKGNSTAITLPSSGGTNLSLGISPGSSGAGYVPAAASGILSGPLLWIIGAAALLFLFRKKLARFA